MTTLEQMKELCDECGAELELGQIGLCDSCQSDASQSINSEQATRAARLAYDLAKAGWEARVAARQRTECLIEGSDIFSALGQLGLPCTDSAEDLVEDALLEHGFYGLAADAFKAYRDAGQL